MKEETIVAIATAMGEGSIGILRLSGPEALRAGQALFISENGKKVEKPEPRKMIYGKIRDPKSDEYIDEALFVYMPGPHSYTAEDVVELHLHGSTQSLQLTLGILLEVKGIRLAEPGEFTQRAFLNGRLDLSQAEAVIDVIRSRTDRSLKAAVGQLSGGLASKIKEISNPLLDLIARLEVVIEYPEDSLEETELPRVRLELENTLKEVEKLRKSGREGKILREGLMTAIIGLPNVGKSSLLNRLLGEERAIVTDIPGTTRDMIEEYFSLGGIPLKLIDTAGIRETGDKVEKIGVERSRKALEEAQFILMVLDGSRDLEPEEVELLNQSNPDQTLILVNKSDLLITKDEVKTKLEKEGFTAPVIFISAETGEGIEELKATVVQWVSQDGALLEGNPLVTNTRQIEALRKGEEALKEAIDALDQRLPPDCILVDIREAWAKISEISGQAVSEQIISHIFSKFCLGK